MSGNEHRTEARRADRGKAFTPPKGRPTRSRDGGVGRRRAFGPVAQWITLALVLVLVVVVLILLTDGGDFNPFDNGDTGVVGIATAVGALVPG